MSKRPLTQVSVADDQSSLRSDKLMLPEEMPERLKDIVRKKQSLLAQIWKDQRNMIQYERSYLTACPHGNVLKGYDPAQTESEFEGVSQCKFSLSCTRMRWYVSKSAELNNRVKEDLKAFKEQIQHPQNQQLNGGPAKRQQLPGQQMQDDPLRHTALNPAMQAPSAYGSQLNAGPGMVPKRMSSLGGFDRSGFDRGGGGWPDPNML